MRDLPAFVPHPHDTESLVAELVRRPSPSGQEAAVARFIASWFQDHGIPAVLTEVVDGRPNVTARLTRGSNGRTLLLFGHTDTAIPTVGWSGDPFVPRRQDGRLIGLGAQDMKGGLAATMLAMQELARRDSWEGTVLFAGVMDEEAYSAGMKAFMAEIEPPDWAILAEPHHNEVLLGYPGKVLVSVHVQGRAAHGSTPHLGVNAITEAATLLTAIEQLPIPNHPLLGRASQCVLRIRGGPDAYVIIVPESCTFSINRHIVPGETGEGIAAQIRELAAALNLRATVDVAIVPPYYPPYLVNPDDDFVQAFATAYAHINGAPPRFGYGHGVCDANYLVAEAGTPTVVYGPHGGNLHSSDEWVDLATVRQCATIYVSVVEEVMGRGRRG